MKDFYDIWVLTQQFQFDQDELFKTVEQVLNRRDTTIDDIPIAFTEAFYNNPSKVEKWRGFLKDISQEDLSLEKVILGLKNYFRDFFSKSGSKIHL